MKHLKPADTPRALAAAMIVPGMLAPAMLAWLVVTLGVTLGVTTTPLAYAGDAPLVREVYVPHDELLKIAATDPSGVVMSLEEYRGLLSRALANRPALRAPVEPPPLGAVAVSSSVSGTVEGASVRLRAVIDIAVAGEGWVRCDLGPAPAHVGSVRVDDAPGWAILEAIPGSGGPRLSLILRGVGRHRAVVELSLPAREEDGWFTVEGTVPSSAGTFLRLDVPGDVTGESNPPFLARSTSGSESDARTSFRIGLGSGGHFNLRWKPRRDGGRQPAIFAAEHLVLFDLRPRSPTFGWRAIVDVFRKKTEAIELVAPRGARVLRVRSAAVHSWTTSASPDGQLIRVVLHEPTDGRVEIGINGVLDEPASLGDEPDGTRRVRFTLGRPRLPDAVRDRGAIALRVPAGNRIGAVTVSGLESIAPGDLSHDAAFLTRWGPQRLWAFSGAEARVQADVRAPSEALEARATHRLTIEERSARLHGAIVVRATTGSVYTVELRVPRSFAIEEVVEAGTGRGLRPFERDVPAEADGSRLVRLDFERGITAEQPVALHATFAWSRDTGEPDFPLGVETQLVLPVVDGATRQHLALGVELVRSLHVSLGSVPGWDAVATERLGALGFESDRLVAALETELGASDVAPPVPLSVVRRSTRGVYEAVTHSVVDEQAQHVRAELRVAVSGRPIEALLVSLPIPVDAAASVRATELREWTVDPQSGRRLLRFQRPWSGERAVRFDFTIPVTVGQPAAIPVVAIDPAPDDGGDPGVLDALRFVVLGSQGGARIDASPGALLSLASVDDLPEFFDVGSAGRVVAVYRVNERAAVTPAAATFVATAFERSPVLGRGISELHLETTIDQSGVSRTEASFTLRYSGDQHLAVGLEAGTSVLAVEIDGESVRPVRSPEENVVRLPLPPRSYATVRFVTERIESLPGRQGTWRERGPRLLGDDGEEVPVGRVTWRIYRPSGLLTTLRGEAVDSLSGRPIETFARSFWGRLLRLRLPRWTAWRTMSPPVARAATSQVSLSIPSSGSGSGGVSQLRPMQLDRGADVPATALRITHEGAPITVTKLGGSPEVTLEYRDPRLDRFQRRFVFLGAVAVGVVLLQLGRRRALAGYVLLGLAIGTFLPPALGWESPLLMIPFAEGIAALALGLAALWIVRRLVALARRWLGPMSLRRSGAAAVLLSAMLAPVAGVAQETQRAMPGGGAPAVDAAVDPPVLIPYSLDDLEIPGAPEKRKVYIPYSKFAELWNLAFHGRDPEDEGETAPVDLVVGNATYVLATDGDRYRIEGTLDVRVFTSEWTALPLSFGGTQLAEVLVDGAPTGVSSGGGTPFVPLRGAGRREVRVVLEGSVARGLGEATVAAELVPAAATRITARLPAQVEIDRSASPTGAPVRVERGDAGDGTVCHVDLGTDTRLVLRWRSPSISSERPPLVTALSASSFELERGGYVVDRLQHVAIEGQEASHLRFRVIGAWVITGVSGADVSEWVLREPEGDGRALEVFFTRRKSSFGLSIRGFASCDEQPSAPADLDLDGATRQEGFVALRHHSLRRFPLDVLRGLSRRSHRDFIAELSRSVPAVSSDFLAGHDRIFHFHDSLANETIRSVSAEPEGALETQAVGLFSSERVAVAVRVRYAGITGPGPLRFEVPVPAGWTVRVARGAAVGDWDVEQVGDQRRLVVRLRQRATDGAEIEWYAEGPEPDPAALSRGIPLPPFRAVSPLRQTVYWVVAGSTDLELGEGQQTDLAPLPLESSPRWLGLDPHMTYRLGYRSQQPGGTLVVTATPRRTVVRSVTTTLLRVAETHVDARTRVRLRVERSGASVFRLRLPSAATSVSVSLPNQLRRRDENTPQGRVITLTLPSPAIGDIELDVAFRLERPAGRSVDLTGVEVLDVDSARDSVAIVRNPLLALRVASTEGLDPIDAGAGESVPPDLAALGVLGGESVEIDESFLVVNRPWRIVLVEEEAEAITGFEALVEFAEIETVLAADGSNWTRAVYTIHNRTLQFLEIRMPEEAELWRVLVNGRPVPVSRRSGVEGESILVPIERMTATDLSIRVALTYTLPPIALPAASATFAPAAPRVVLDGLQSFETLWRVHVPQGHVVSSIDGNLREVIAGVHHGERVRNLIGQIGRIQKRLDEPETDAVTRRERTRARRNLIELQRALEDAVQDLRDPAAQSLGEGRAIQADEYAQQLKESRDFIDRGTRRVVELKKQTAAPEEEGGLPPVDRAFEGAREFLEGRWSATRSGAPQSNEGQQRGGGEGIPLDSFRDALGPVQAPAVSRDETDPSASGGANGVPSILGSTTSDDRAFLAESLGVDMTLPSGGELHTFRGKVSTPNLELDLAARDLDARLWHAIGLAATVAVIVLWTRRTRRRVR